MTKEIKQKLNSYILGFSLSLLLTCVAFFMVYVHKTSNHVLISHQLIMEAIIPLAFLQLIIQLFLFLHLGKESKPRWNLLMFLSTIGLVGIVIGGSLWIMNNLNYHMTPRQMNSYMQSQDGF